VRSAGRPGTERAALAFGDDPRRDGPKDRFIARDGYAIAKQSEEKKTHTSGRSDAGDSRPDRVGGFSRLTISAKGGRNFNWVARICRADLAASRPGRTELHLYTGTLIKDLYAAVERAEHSARSRSSEDSRSRAVSAGERCAETSQSQPEEFPQTFGLSPTDWNLALLLIVHAQLVRAFEPRHDFADSIDIHQVGAVSPPEQSRVQAGE
jgi:hypothetical protein